MKTLNTYTWKIGVEYDSNRELNVNKPLVEGSLIMDLHTGGRYRVSHIFKAGEHDRANLKMPETVIQTWRIEDLPEKELAELRTKVGYEPGVAPRPYEAVVTVGHGIAA